MTNEPYTDDSLAALKGRRRRLLFRLRRATRLLDQRMRLQDIGYGLLAAAIALAVPAAQPFGAGAEVAARLGGEKELTQGLLLPIGTGMMEVFESLTPRTTMRLISAVCFGVALMLTLGFLRRLGFRRTAAIPATAAAFLAPYPWIGSTSPIDYAAGLFGASLVLWSLFQPEQSTKRGYHWRAILSTGLAYMLYMESALLIPAVALAVARHPRYRGEASMNFYAVFMVLGMMIAIGLAGTGESARVEHFAERVLAGANGFSWRSLGAWIVALPIGFGAILLGLYQLLFAPRGEDQKRAPMWIVPWCLVALAPVIAGSPEYAPIAPYLVPAGALGLADWLNHRGTRRGEVRFGAVLVVSQIVATVVIAMTRA